MRGDFDGSDVLEIEPVVETIDTRRCSIRPRDQTYEQDPTCHA